MSTPIETNTEELQEILQTVYNLPLAGGGSSKADLVITPDENFRFIKRSPTNPDFNVEKVLFDPNDVIATYEKLLSGNDVRVVLTGRMFFNEEDPKYMATFPAMRVLAASIEAGNNGDYLVVRIPIADGYWHLSDDGIIAHIEYRFFVNTDTGEANLSGSAYWTNV